MDGGGGGGGDSSSSKDSGGGGGGGSNSSTPIAASRPVAIKILRVIFYNDTDHITEMEDILDFSPPLMTSIGGLKIKCEFGLDMMELLALVGQFEGYERKCYGPQEEELGEQEVNPFVFNRRVR